MRGGEIRGGAGFMHTIGPVPRGVPTTGGQHANFRDAAEGRGPWLTVQLAACFCPGLFAINAPRPLEAVAVQSGALPVAVPVGVRELRE